MSKAQHTPGPWFGEYDEGDWRGLPITSADREGKVEICLVATGFNEPFESEQNANARLIAAAPDMLEALRAMDAASTMQTVWDALVIGRAAIAKAEGRS